MPQWCSLRCHRIAGVREVQRQMLNLMLVCETRNGRCPVTMGVQFHEASDCIQEVGHTFYRRVN